MFRKTIPYLAYRKIKYSYLGDTSPAVASIKVTQRCNLRCKHCTWVNKVTQDLPLERWRGIIDTIYQTRFVRWYLWRGGEPTLREDIGNYRLYKAQRAWPACLYHARGTCRIGYGGGLDQH